MNKRVVITGLGLITPLGTGSYEIYERFLNGENGIRRITKFDPDGFSSQIAGEVDFDEGAFIPPKEARKMDNFIKYAIAASEIAVQDSGLKIDSSNCNEIGVLIGSGIGGLNLIEQQYKVLMERGPRRVSPFFIPSVIINLASGAVSIRLGAKGPNSSVVTACATGTNSIGDAFKIIQRGDAVAMIAGGCEAAITPLAVAGFGQMKALSTRNEEPEKASRPFDKDRDGFVIGEGAGVLILEEMEHALNRGAKIYAEVVGYGMSGDAYHITAPAEDGDGARRAMAAALRDAGIKPEDVDYINAHGTSTYYNDKIETKAIKDLFGEQAYKLKINSTKSMTGHLLGGAGGLEAGILALTLFTGKAHPTRNLEVKDPECDLDYIQGRFIEFNPVYGMSNSFGFGGTNASLVMRKFEE